MSSKAHRFSMDSSSLSILLLLLPLLLFFSIPHSHSHSHASNSETRPKCHENERDALLEFKSISCNERCISKEYLTTWKEGDNEDCCIWESVECDKHSGHVIVLDLSDRYLSGSIDSSSSIFKLSHLHILVLSSNDFGYSQITSAISNLSQLESLDLYGSNFSGQIPSGILNLTNLSYLDLSGNQLRLKNPGLRDLMQSLVKLETVHLSTVEISSSIPESLSRLILLRSLYLFGCKLQGHLPSSLSNLTKLEWIDLSNNQLTGEIFSFAIDSSIRPKSKLSYLGLASCNLRSFLLLLQNQYRLEYLDLSSNAISGEVPQWFLNVSMEVLNFLNLSHNHLSGSLPIPSTNSSFQYYFVSNNEFLGELPTRMCDLTKLVILDVGNNKLGGMIPRCLAHLGGTANLNVLNLYNNNFSGPIPQIGKHGCNLVMVNMSYNQLEGPVPRVLENFLNLEFLNLGSNRIIDVFPFWLGKLPTLSMLILHSNRFHGNVGKHPDGYNFPKLQIIDLSANNFTGYLSTEFIGWRAMNIDSHKQDRTMSYARYNKGKYPYFYTVTMTNKGIILVYTKIPESLIGIDLSSNHFTGEIPKSIATLKGLHFLNLSNNMFIGPIPSYLNGLTNLESLDLSHNNLSGEIPQLLTELTALELFDVSFNQLTGPLPQSKQFNTFQNSSYQGNLGLCGPPLSRKCGNVIDSSLPPSFEKDHASRTWIEFDRKIVSMGYTIGFVIGAAVGMQMKRGCKRVKRVRQIKFVLN